MSGITNLLLSMYVYYYTIMEKEYIKVLSLAKHIRRKMGSLPIGADTREEIKDMATISLLGRGER